MRSGCTEGADPATDTFGDLGATFTSSGGATITAVLSKADGTDYAYTAAATAPASPSDGDYWIDTSNTTHYLKVYSESNGTWNTIETVYVKISGTGLGASFADNDGVTISGMSDSNLNGDFVVVDCGLDYIIVTAIIDANTSQTTAVTVARVIPTMDFVTECNNRIWGCSSANHEIYACKLGDPKNWNVFAGISTDSYAATVGSGGNFTGAATHMGYVLFFKENCIHKLYGTQPSNFVLSEDAVRGVASGSERSIAVVNETLFYHSYSGVCAYGMALPESISNNLGTGAYTDVVAGKCVNKYYMSAKNAALTYEMFVYDTKTGAWMKEDTKRASYMASIEDDLYFIDTDGYLWSVSGNITDYASTPSAETAFTWMLETGDIGLTLPDNKYISKVHLMMAAAVGASITVQMAYDGGAFATVATLTSLPTKNVKPIPFVTPRCRTLKIKLTGSGIVKLYGITKTIESGSDVYV